MDRRVTPPNKVTSPTWGPPPQSKQALSNNNIISALRPGLKTVMDFRGLVRKQVWKMTFFGLK